MKKIILGISLGVFLFLGIGNTNVAAQFSACSSTNGCVRCTYNTSNDTCGYDASNVIPEVGCNAGANPPQSVGATCSSHDGDPGNCQNTYLQCQSPTITGGGYFCNVQGTVKTCDSCGPGTANPTCPANNYSTQAQCNSSCVIPNDNFNCVSSGGICQSSCGKNQHPTTGTCATGNGVCCGAGAAVNSNAAAVGPNAIVCPDGISVNTAIGCVPIGNENDLVSFFLKWGIGIGGGIAFLLIVLAGFQIMTSRGDPNRLKAGQELMTSAIAGLLLLIFSIVILRIIGFDILQIGAFKL